MANTRLDECRRLVQNEILGHRGRKDDPLYRARRLLTKADGRLDDRGRSKLLGLLSAGDPSGEVKAMWHAKQVVRSIYDHRDPVLALEFVTRLGRDLQDEDDPPEAHLLGRTLLRWRHQICAWHPSGVSNGPTEAINNLVKGVKRVASDRGRQPPQLAHPRPALRRPTQLEPTPRHRTPLRNRKRQIVQDQVDLEIT